MKRITTIIVVLHTLIAAISVLPALKDQPFGSESWPFFGAFILDFPISMLFHPGVEHVINPLVKMTGIGGNIVSAKYWIAFCHFVFGAVWWVFLAKIAMNAKAFLYRHNDGKA